MKTVLVAATLFMAAVGFAAAADPVTENWKDDEGDNMVLEVQPDSFTGIYDGGRLNGTLQKNGSYAGFWMQDTSEQECADKKNGTTFWGRFEFTFDAKRRHFKGVYSYCDAKPAASDTWDGDRIDDAAASETPSSDAASSSAVPEPSASAIEVSMSSEPAAASSSAAPSSAEVVAAASSSAASSVPPGPFTRHHH